MTLEASSYNWFGDASCALSGPGDKQDATAWALGPLAENGGFVPTRAPAPSSVLVNAIPAAACPTALDARGFSRPQGPACDIGAVEVGF